MARPEKVAAVTAIAERLRSAQSIVLADYTGLTVEKMTAFRALCRGKGVECRVVKNRLARIAADQVHLEALKEHLQGPTALVLGPHSQVEPARAVMEFAKDNEALRVKGGVLDGRFLQAAAVASLAKIPDREVLLSQMMAGLNGPARALACATNGVVAGFVRALDAVAKQKAA
jgi:large subunit ribosomal protein L10